MPRLKIRNTSRALILLLVIWTFYYLTIGPWWSADRAGIDYGRGRGRSDVLRHVNMFIGTKNGGHAFPGASLPYGMAKASPDCVGESHGGFASDGSDISGFSHMHDSGTGGAISLGNFPIFPQFCDNDNLTTCKYSSGPRRIPRREYSASPGYFDITLADGIRGESTVSAHTALYRFTFPSNTSYYVNASRPVISLDVADLAGMMVSNAAVSIVPEIARIYGNGTFRPSFGVGSYSLHFCADFKSTGGQDEVGIWEGSAPVNKTIETKVLNHAGGGGYAVFDLPKASKEVLVRVGLSFISVDKACRNAKTEIPDFDFDRVKSTAEKEWRQKLQVVDVRSGGVDEDLQVIFWSGIYRTMISPQDYTGENPLWNSSEPYFDSFYCIWDSFRSQHPFLTLVDPVEQTRMVRSLIDIYKFEGKLPDCRMSLCKGFTQGGSNADIVLADAFIKNLTTGIDWELGYEAVVSDAEDEPKLWNFGGRGGLESWKSLSYIPFHNVDKLGQGLNTRSISRTVEYAYDDFCIGEMAGKLGRLEDQAKYHGRANNWRNIYNENQPSLIKGNDTGFVGFLQPRDLNGEWIEQDPILCSPLLNFDSCYFDGGGHETYEGSCWLYTFFVPQDMAALVALLGGPSQFIKRLDFLHESGLLYMGDEQAFLTVFLYHYAGRPALSAERAHAYVPSQFNNTENGIPGNDDSGAMGSFVAFLMMGIFPNPGQDVYLIIPPFFESVSITNPLTGKTATIANINFDPKYENIYIQKATLNGRPWTKNWINHAFFTDGGLLELTVGPKESDWGTRAEDLPPSLSTGAILARS